MNIVKQTAWHILISLYVYGMTDRLLDYQKEGFSQYELSVLLVPLFCLILTVLIKPR